MTRMILREFRDHKMYLMPADAGICKTLMRGQGAYDNRELAFMNLLKSNITEGDVCMDIGANIGFSTLCMAKLVGEDGHVYAIEPDIVNIEVLQKNRDINDYEDRISIDGIAISDKNGITDFFLSNKSNLGALSKNKNCSGEKRKVSVFTLDTYLDGKKLPDFYKMDVEGHEANVLNGMHRIAELSKVGTKILMEVHPQFYTKDLDMEKALRDMINLGFHFKYVISAGVPIPELFSRAGYQPSITYDNFSRAVYNDISDEDAIYFCSKPHEQYMPSKKKNSPKIVRAIMLEKGE